MVAFANFKQRPPDPDEPPAETLAWCKNLVRSIKHGGVWGIPRSGVVFEIDQENKRLILREGAPDNPDFLATRHVFAYIGWQVVDTK
jgi:hypothetical protein